MYFGTKMSKICFRIISFRHWSQSFDSVDSEINFDRARSTTVNSLLRGLRAIYNIPRYEEEELFAGELLTY